jgi:hypothetical protein
MKMGFLVVLLLSGCTPDASEVDEHRVPPDAEGVDEQPVPPREWRVPPRDCQERHDDGFCLDWREMPSLATPRAGHCAFLLEDDQILVAGGATGDRDQPTLLAPSERFDGEGWQPAADLPSPVSNAACVRLPNGMPALVGGWADGTDTQHVQAFDGAGWVTLPSTTAGHNQAQWGPLAGGRIAVWGGGSRQVELFDGTSWRSLGAPDDARYGVGAGAVVGEDTLLVTGYDAEDDRIAWLLDVNTGVWTVLEDAPLNDGFTATSLGDGTVALAAGWHYDSDSQIVTLFTPSDRSFQRASLGFYMPGHSATRLANDTVLIVGGPRRLEHDGTLPDDVVAETLLFNPADLSTQRLPARPGRHAGHRAVQLADGTVVAIGGRQTNSQEPFTSSVYAWGP